MNDRARQKLIQILDTEPPGILDEPERLEALLRDYCGDCRREISALMTALQEDVPRDLSRLRNDPYPILTSRLADKLHEERSIMPEAAQWSVEAWAIALEIAPGSERQRGTGGTIAPGPVRPVQDAASGPAKLPEIPPWSPQITPPAGNEMPWTQEKPRGNQPQVPWQTPVNPGPAQNQDAAAPWQQPGWNHPPFPGAIPSHGTPAAFSSALAAPPLHNSFLVGGACFGATFLILLLMSNAIRTFGTLGGFWDFVGLLILVVAMAGGVELLLGIVRVMLKKPQPPSFVVSSFSFWMALFRMEDRMLGMMGRKAKAPLPPGAPLQPPVPAMSAPANPPASPQAQQATPVPGAASSVFCISCGATNAAGAAFCLNCGEKLFYPGAPQN